MRIQKKYALDDMKSARELAIENKEKLSKEPTELQKTIDKYKSNGISSGNDNLCKFGTRNTKFGKVYNHVKEKFV